ncbi:MAG: hypothetical protein QOE97_3510 [Pseudonocardiales bacterium]|jgi:hypothetical protein|nr:hypothetical protein [Pseudonocardiales bacterium]
MVASPGARTTNDASAPPQPLPGAQLAGDAGVRRSTSARTRDDGWSNIQYELDNVTTTRAPTWTATDLPLSPSVSRMLAAITLDDAVAAVAVAERDATVDAGVGDERGRSPAEVFPQPWTAIDNNNAATALATRVLDRLTLRPRMSGPLDRWTYQQY